MLTSDDIKQGALYISTTKDEWFELMDFFYEQKKPGKPPAECYPVILVVDEVSEHCIGTNMSDILALSFTVSVVAVN